MVPAPFASRASPDYLAFTLDQTVAAARVQWRYFTRAHEWIIPPEPDTARVVELGTIHCGGTTLPPEELEVGGHLELFAIRLDGTEVRIDMPPESSTDSLLHPAPSPPVLDVVDFELAWCPPMKRASLLVVLVVLAACARWWTPRT